jgi:hypothetical protein
MVAGEEILRFAIAFLAAWLVSPQDTPSCAFANLPGGQITESCLAPFEKIFRFSADPNHF